MKTFIDNEQVAESESNLSFPIGIVFLWLIGLAIVIIGLFWAWQI